jgi:hypothetical protein
MRRAKAGESNLTFAIPVKPKTMLKKICNNIIGTVKVLALLPMWLLILPLRKDRIFRHYAWTLDGFRRGAFTRTAYACCFVCWLVFGWLVVRFAKLILPWIFG